VHPQFWPDDLDYAGKQVVVIGSGATAVTLVPSMAKGARGAAKVTMLQRTPTWMFSRPAKDRIANFLRKVLPEKLAYRVTRWKNITLQHLGFKRARTKPEKMKQFLHKRIEKALGPDYDRASFTPPYDPWDQRLCLIPDDDLFEAMKKGRAEIVTGHIAAFEQGGVRLKDDRHLPADIVVTATGLKLAVAGKIAISQNGEPVDLAERFYYKGCMFSNLPNLAVVFGYLNASWTLRSDINADFICRVLERMRATGATIAEPVLPADHDLVEDDIFDFSSGYIQRSKHLMPKNAVAYPWRLNQEYVTDRKRMASDSIEDGVLDLRRADGQDASSQEGRLEPAG
jgi:cation diffusion facilitator CzcD-associated flavoprotein CzcO